MKGQEKDDQFKRQGTKGPIRRRKPNPLVKCCSNIFTKMYPAKKKTAWTNEGKWLRTCVGVACIAHVLFFIFSIAFVGFKSMMINLILACISYSGYLTLREWVVLFHVFGLMAACFWSVFHELKNKTEST